MAGGELEQVDGVAAGAWIGPALGEGFGGRVAKQVPQVFEAYVRIFHPAGSEEGEEVTWGEVARQLGTTAHREMQWHAIVGTHDYTNFQGSRWPGSPPNRAEMADEELDSLRPLLAAHTGTAERCFFGISTIHGGVDAEFAEAPFFELPHREYVVLAGPLAAVDQITLGSRHFGIAYFYAADAEPPPDHEPPERFFRQAPSMIWPEDRAWFFHTEYDFDSTLVGGSRALVDAILAAPGLEAWEVDGEVSLACDADAVNPVPDPPPGFDEPQDPVELGRDFVGGMGEFLSGEVVTAAVEDGVLRIEVAEPGGRRWTLEAANSTWSPDDPSTLRGREVAGVGLVDDTYTLRLSFAEGEPLDVAPLPPTPEDPPSWRLQLPGGPTQIHMHHWPWLFTEHPDEPGP
jgi:hypothetical protein